MEAHRGVHARQPRRRRLRNLGRSLGYGTSRRHRQALQPGGRARRGQAGEAKFPVEEIEVTAIEDHRQTSPTPWTRTASKASRSPSGRTASPTSPWSAESQTAASDAVWPQAQGGLRAARQDDPAFGRMPCRIVEGVSDDQAVTLLHTANYFTRELNVIERAKATQALGIQVERMRAENPELKGCAPRAEGGDRPQPNGPQRQPLHHQTPGADRAKGRAGPHRGLEVRGDRETSRTPTSPRSPPWTPIPRRGSTRRNPPRTPAKRTPPS